jgi:hypothetical protein
VRAQGQRGLDQVPAVQEIEHLAHRDGVDRGRAGHLVRRALCLHPEEGEERVDHERRADEENAPNPEAGDDRPVDRARQPAHDVRLVRFERDGEAQRDGGDHVHPQDLRRGDRQREAEQDRERDHGALRDVGRQDVEDGLLDVVVDGAPFLHRRGDRSEVVVDEDHPRRLLRHLGALDPHRDADVRLLEGRRIVDAVARHGDDLPVGLDRLDKPQLVLGAGAREDVDVAHALLQRRIVHRLDLGAGHGRLAVADAEHAGDGGRRDLVVARDHRDTDAAAMALAHCLDGLLARRVHEAHEAEEHERLRQVLRAEAAARREAGVRQPRQPQHALALRGHPVALPGKALPVERCRARCRLLAVAVLQDDFRGALDQQHLAVRGAVQRRHELVLGLEGNRVDPRRRSRLRGALHAELVRERIEGALGRVALDFPSLAVLEDLGVVAQEADAAHQRQHLRRGADRVPAFPDLAFGRVAVAGHLVGRIGRHDGSRHHLHQGQRARLVRADARDGAQRLHGRQPANDGVALGHALHADRERDGDERRQPFRDDGDGDAHDRLEQLHERHVPEPVPPGEEQHAEARDGHGDGDAELPDLAQQRRLERADLAEHLVDPPQLRLAARRHDDAGGAARNDHGAGERHVLAVAYRGLGGHGSGGLVGRDRFAGQRRLFRAQVPGLDQAQVGRDLVARFQEHDVAGHEFLGGNQANRPGTQDARLGGQHVADRVERLLGAPLLQEAQQRVQDDDREDDRGVQPQAQHQLDEAGREQDIDEEVIELGEEARQRPLLLALRQPVRPMLGEPPGCIRCVEALRRNDIELPLHLVGRHGVPCRRVPARGHCLR